MMEFDDTDITQLISTIWQSVLGIESMRSSDLSQVATATVAACVQITGEWQGAVMLSCSKAFGVLAAQIMFGTPANEQTLTDIQDAVAELTNMIGGNLKGLLPLASACQLSLPAVVASADYTARVPGSRSLNRIVLNCAGETVVVDVLEKMPAACAA